MEKRQLKNNEEPVNCLTDERIIVRFVPKESGIRDPKHILYGGMARAAVRCFTVPMLQSGKMVNILTDNEKAYLEQIMGLEYNALSIYNKDKNFWANYQVRLEKGDNYLSLSEPDDYIRYKVLLANKDYIAPSISELENKPKSTYQFVIIREGDEKKKIRSEVNLVNDCFIQFGKIQEDRWTLKTIIETIGGRPISEKTSIEDMQVQVNKYILASPKLFHSIIDDNMLAGKVLLKKCVNKGLIGNRGGFYYLKEGNLPLCKNNEEPNINTAARFILSPENQELKLSLEAKSKDA